MVVLHGSTAATSKVLCCFSQSNDPSDGWWVYNLTGDPLSNNQWFDYPAIGVSTNEVYVTGNLFSSGGNVFGEAVIYQLPKASGYAGQAISWAYWDGIATSPYDAFSLVPASWGQLDAMVSVFYWYPAQQVARTSFGCSTSRMTSPALLR